MAGDAAASIAASAQVLAWNWPTLQALETPNPNGRVESSPSLPGGTLRMSLLAWVPTLANDWAGYTARKQGHHHAPTAGVESHCLYLGRWADALAATSMGTWAAGELGEAAHQLAVLTDPDPVRCIPIGDCPQPGCCGEVRAHTDPSGAWLQVLVCSGVEQHCWHRPDWPELAVAMGEAECPRLGIDDLARYLSTRFPMEVTTRHIKAWARAHPVTFATDGHGRYSRVEVTAWLVGRRAERAQVAR